MVKLHCQSLAERLLIPPFVFFFFLLYPPAWICDPRRKVAGAAGGCMLVRPEALARAGGVVAIRSQIIDDCALAQAIKRSGGKLWLGLTQDACSTRAYGTFGEIERMISRTAFNQLRHSAWLLLGALVGLTITYLLPLGLLAVVTCNTDHRRCGQLAADGCHVPSHGAVLRTESGVGADPAAQRLLLHGGDASFGHQVLVRSRRRVERSRAGRRVELLIQLMGRTHQIVRQNTFFTSSLICGWSLSAGHVHRQVGACVVSGKHGIDRLEKHSLRARHGLGHMGLQPHVAGEVEFLACQVRKSLSPARRLPAPQTAAC